jgi:hypothetical protein
LGQDSGGELEVYLLIKVLDQMNLGGDERKAEILAKIGTVLEKELADYELDFQEMKDITPEEIEQVKQAKMEEEIAKFTISAPNSGE